MATINSQKIKFHIGFWLVYIIIYTILGASYKQDFTNAIIFELLNLPMRLLVAYVNYFCFLPILFKHNKSRKYIAYTLISLVVAGFIQRIINYEMLNIIRPDMPDYGLWLPYKFLQAIFIVGTPMIILIGIVSINKMSELQRRTKSLENEKLESELKYLKSQTNPHFLFNNLNNIYGLSLEKSDKTAELILKLSDFLSFSLYESSKTSITLEKEISLIKDYIDLEKSRFDDRVDVNVSFPSQTNTILIPPLILLPFIENAFKHSLKDETQKAIVNIKLKLKGKYLTFLIFNSKPSVEIKSQYKNGLGLKNITKRLSLIYNKDYELKIKEGNNDFEVNLKIKVL